MKFVELKTTSEVVSYLAHLGIRDAKLVVDVERNRITVLCHQVDLKYARKFQTSVMLPGNPSITIRRFRFWEKKPYKIEVNLL
jgi:hypothetical protein